MILFYIIGILCSLVLFAPATYVPAYVKWPIALLVALLVVFVFNLVKKDTHNNKKRVIDCGLFNPLIMYLAASIYVLGFTLIINHLQALDIKEFVSEFDKIFASLEYSLSNNLFSGLLFVVLAIIIYLIRNGFRKNANETGIGFRSFWYIAFTLIALLIGIFNFDTFREFDIYAYLTAGTGYNLYIYLGLAGLVVFLDLIFNIIGACCSKKKAKKEEAKSSEIVVEDASAENNEVESENVVLTKKEVKKAKKAEKCAKKQAKRDAKKAKKDAKRAKVIAKERKRIEKKLAKKEAKIDKKISKVEKKMAKKIAKLERKKSNK